MNETITDTQIGANLSQTRTITYCMSSRHCMVSLQWLLLWHLINCCAIFIIVTIIINPLIATLKPHSNGPSYSNTVIGTLTVNGWAVTVETVRRGLGGATARPCPSSLYQL